MHFAITLNPREYVSWKFQNANTVRIRIALVPDLYIWQFLQERIFHGGWAIFYNIHVHQKNITLSERNVTQLYCSTASTNDACFIRYNILFIVTLARL